MAKKKTFGNIVDESFKDGYDSDPEIIPPQLSPERPRRVSAFPEETLDSTSVEKPLTENELLLQDILGGNEDALKNIWERKDRSTYYLTDLHRACIEEAAREEGVKKNDIVIMALERLFDEMGIVTAGKKRAIAVAVKSLEKEIKKASTNK